MPQSDDSPMTDVWSSGAPPPPPTGAPSANPIRRCRLLPPTLLGAPPAAQPSGAYNGAGAGNGPSGAADKSVSERERELMAREATLAAKEAQIARLETEAAQNAALAAGGPQELAALLAPWCATTSGRDPAQLAGPCSPRPTGFLPASDREELGSFFLAVIYLVTATPLAMFPVVHAAVQRHHPRPRHSPLASSSSCTSSTSSFCFWAAIAPPIGSGGSQRSFAGLFLCLNVFSEGLGFGILAVIGTIMWALEAVWSLLVLQQTYSQFPRGRRPPPGCSSRPGAAAQTMQMMTGANNA
eukprot:jgi/Tetstr1/423846/TSEL_014472.t1